MAENVTGAIGNMPTPRVGAEWVPARDLPIPAPQPDASAGAPDAPPARPAGAEPAPRSPEAREQEQQSHKPPAPSGGR
jgi:hypothetical protein